MSAPTNVEVALRYAIMEYVGSFNYSIVLWGEPHHVRSTVKFVFLLACLLVSLYACHYLIWLSAIKSTLKAI